MVCLLNESQQSKRVFSFFFFLVGGRGVFELQRSTRFELAILFEIPLQLYCDIQFRAFKFMMHRLLLQVIQNTYLFISQ